MEGLISYEKNEATRTSKHSERLFSNGMSTKHPKEIVTSNQLRRIKNIKIKMKIKMKSMGAKQGQQLEIIKLTIQYFSLDLL
jgi:hypothetical protein